jgi:hypothetical protein
MSDTASLKKSPDSRVSTRAVDLGGEAQLSPPLELTAAQELALYRKIDLRLMPIMILMYLLASMDRGTPFYVVTTPPDHGSCRKHRERQDCGPH